VMRLAAQVPVIHQVVLGVVSRLVEVDSAVVRVNVCAFVCVYVCVCVCVRERVRVPWYMCVNV